MLSNIFLKVKNKTWQHQYIHFEERFDYCLCSFNKKLFLIGGWVRRISKNIRSCCFYNFNSDNWTQMADLNKARDSAACTVFEGKLIITGGCNVNDVLKSVESYDYYENKWT